MDKNNGDHPVSLAKVEANRRNAQHSTGPKTETGKARSRRNAVKHGLLASTLVCTAGLQPRDRAEFNELLLGLRSDLMPIGTLEEMLIEKIAVCWWRQKLALACEIRILPRACMDLDSVDPEWLIATDMEKWHHTDLLRRACGPQMDRILRYETTIHRELVYSLNQLERLQRARKGEYVPAPVSVQLSSEE